MHESYYLPDWCPGAFSQIHPQTGRFLQIGQDKFSRKKHRDHPTSIPPIVRRMISSDSTRQNGIDGYPELNNLRMTKARTSTHGRKRCPRYLSESVRVGHLLGRGEPSRLHPYASWEAHHEKLAYAKTSLGGWRRPLLIQGTHPVALGRWEQLC